MAGVYDVASVRQAEELLMAVLPEGALMDRAATGLADACATLLREAGVDVVGSRIVLLIGSGNNGGDALYAGARLARRGAQVRAICLSPTCHDGGAQALREAGGRLTDPAHGDELVAQADLVVDGIVGIGGRGGLRAEAAALAEAAKRSGALIIAVDIPSGVDANTGAVADPVGAVDADATVTFGCLKPGLLVAPGRDRAGAVILIDIGLRPVLPDAQTHVLGADALAAFVPEPDADDYKYSRGVVGIAAGSARYRGAAFMATGSARFGNVGMVHVLDRGDGLAAAIVDRFWDVVVSTDAPATVERATAWTVGPGLDIDADGVATLSAVLAADRPVVVDADGLRMLRDDGPWSVLQSRSAPTVITPHQGEFAALGYHLRDGAESDRVGAARAAARDLGVVVVLKGPGTVVAAPGGVAYVDTWGGPELGVAGSGDVLAGLTGALLAGAVARGECPDGDAAAHVAAAAVGLHGIAGRLAARDGRTVTAPDIIAALPEAIGGIRRGVIT